MGNHRIPTEIEKGLLIQRFQNPRPSPLSKSWNMSSFLLTIWLQTSVRVVWFASVRDKTRRPRAQWRLYGFLVVNSSEFNRFKWRCFSGMVVAYSLIFLFLSCGTGTKYRVLEGPHYPQYESFKTNNKQWLSNSIWIPDECSHIYVGRLYCERCGPCWNTRLEIIICCIFPSS